MIRLRRIFTAKKHRTVPCPKRVMQDLPVLFRLFPERNLRTDFPVL